MTISVNGSLVPATGALAPGVSTIGKKSALAGGVSGRSFKQVYNGVRQGVEQSPTLYDQIVQFDKRLQGVGELSPKELLHYQITLSRFHLRVEMVSKLAEGGMATLRKLESQG